MAQQRALPQSKETLLQSYNKRLKDDVKSIMDNFTEIIKTAKVGGGRRSPAPLKTNTVVSGAESGRPLSTAPTARGCSQPGDGHPAVSPQAGPSSPWGERLGGPRMGVWGRG